MLRFVAFVAAVVSGVFTQKAAEANGADFLAGQFHLDTMTFALAILTLLLAAFAIGVFKTGGKTKAKAKAGAN